MANPYPAGTYAHAYYETLPDFGTHIGDFNNKATVDYVIKSQGIESSLANLNSNQQYKNFVQDYQLDAPSDVQPVENIYKQLKGQSQNLGTAKTFETGAAGTKEGGLGSVDNVMWDMAKRLSDAGLTSIEQLGQGRYGTYYPEMAQSGYRGSVLTPTGRWYNYSYDEAGEGGAAAGQKNFISAEQAAGLGLKATSYPQTYEEMTTGESKFAQTVPVSSGGALTYYNKATGQPIPEFNNVKGGGWARNTAGDGQTVYGVKFDPSTGLPIFVNQQTHGRDEYADLLKIAAIGTAIFAPQIGAALLPAGSSAAAALAVGSAVSGFIGSGGDLKAGIKAGLAGYLGGQAGSWASKASNSALVGNIASNMTRTAILGGDMKQALVASLVQAAPAEIIKHFPNFAELPRAAQEAAVAATVDLMRTGGENLEQIAIKGATDGITDYTLKQIPGFDDLRKGQQEIVRERVGNVVRGESLSKELLQGVISYGQEAVQNEVNNDKAKKAGWADYATQQAAKSLYGDKVTPEIYADKQDTTEAEAKQIARDILGREPTEFEYMQLIGLPEREAAQNSDLQAIRYNESTFDSGELAQAYKAVYGKEPTAEWLASDEAMDMLGRSEAQGKNMLQNLYIQDKNTTNNTEAEAIWKEMGNTGPIPEDLLFKMLSTSEDATRAMSETYRIRSDDIEKTTFNGSGYESRVAAERAAKAAGYNTYKWDGADYPIPATAEIKAIQDKRHELTEGILKQQGTTVAEATDEQLMAALAKVDALPTSYLKQATIQDVIKGTYSVIDADGKFKVEVTGANIVADSPASVVQKAKDQLPKGMTLASDAEIWGVGGERNPNVEYMVLPDGTTAYVKRDAGTQLPEQFIVAKRLDDLEVNDPEAWLGLAAQFDKKQDGTVSDYLVNTANSLMLGAYATGNDKFGDAVKQTLSLVTQGVGEQVTNLATFFTDRLGMDHNSAFAAAGKALQDWGVANQSINTKNQEDRIKDAVEKAEGVAGKIGAFVSAVRENPGGFMTMVAKEGVQEILPLWAAKAAYRFGTLAAVSANTAIEAMESWGAGTKETYEEAKRMGFSDEDARIMASKVGLQSAVITTFTNGVGDTPLVKRIIGDTVRDSAMGITKASAREGFTEYFDSLGSNAVQQYQLTGTVNWNQATTAATIGMGVGAGTTAGIMTGFAIKSGTVIGQDAFGEGVTYADFVSGARQVDMGTVNLNAPVFSTPSGQEVTLGGALVLSNDAGVVAYTGGSYLPAVQENTILSYNEAGFPVSYSAYQSAAAGSPNARPSEIFGGLLVPTDGEYVAPDLVGQTPATPTAPPASDVTDVVDKTPALTDQSSSMKTAFETELARAVELGYRNQDAIAEAVARTADALDILPVNVLGTIGKTQDQLFTQYLPQVSVPDAVAPEVPATTPVTPPAAPPTTPTTPPTSGEVVSVDPDSGTALVVDGNGNVEVVDNTDGALAPGDTLPVAPTAPTAPVTPITPTTPVTPPTQTQPETGGGTQTGGVDFADPTENVVDPTLQDLLSGIGETTTPNLPAVIPPTQPTTPATPVAPIRPTTPTAPVAPTTPATPVLPTAPTTPTTPAAPTKPATLTPPVAPTTPITPTQPSVPAAPTNPDVSSQLAGVEARLNEAIAAAEDMGLSRDQAITAAVESVAAELGTTKTALLAQLGTTEAALRGEIAGVSADVQAKFNALTNEQKALATQLQQQGVNLNTAIFVAAQQTQQKITNLGVEVDARINQLMQQGQTYQQATQQAIGELNQQNQQLQGLVGTQGRTATQADIDALNQMLSGQRSMDLAYDVTGDKQITQADIDFLTNVVGGTNTDWTPPVGSVFGPTGLYGQLATAEAQRQADLAAQIERERVAEEQRQRQQKISTAQQGIQSLIGMMPQMYKAAEETTTPLYSTMDYYDPFGDPFADRKMRTASTTIPTDQTKMAQGGYLDTSLAEELSVDDLLNLLR
jgi:hypothetical protein